MIPIMTKKIKRRDLILGTGAAAVAASASTVRAQTKTFRWKMVTTWPPNFPGLGTSVVRMVKNIERASGGRIKIKLFSAGELVPAFEVFDFVSSGGAELWHGAAYYWRGKSEAAQIFTTLPFGLNAMELNGWHYFGGAQKLYRELYEPFNLLPFPCGNSGCQMGGWFKKSIDTIEDIKGLKMRIPGFGGEVLRRNGGTPVAMPGGEIFTALQTGTIDAAEWIGPYNDLAFGMHKVAKHYYYPGWHEGGPSLECIINKEAFESLPDDLQAIVEIAIQSTNDTMLAEFVARNASALQQIRKMKDIEIKPFPNEIMAAFEKTTDEIIKEIEDKDPLFSKIYQSFSGYKKTAVEWTKISEYALLKNRYKD